MVKKLLEACGARVTAIASADEAMRAIRTAHPDILISDIGMQGTNGYELIRQIRRLKPEEGGLVPGIALTAYASPRDRKRALKAGYQAHLAKPIDPDELLIVVASLAWQSGTHR
jgi:CheY-like chemotaxis protein